MSTVWLGVLYLHLVAMAFFVGGQIMLAATIVPVERRSPDAERMGAIARRFGYGSALALAVLLATGIAMASRYDLWQVGTLQLELALVGAVIALTFVHMRFPRAHALSAAIFVLTLAIVWLGVDLGR